MKLSFVANWLNKKFLYFDYNILKFWHDFAKETHNAFTPFFEFISFLAENGIILILISIILMCFRKTKKIGLCTFFSIIIGAIITNLFLKNIIARPRPFMGMYDSWWSYVGALKVKEYSFPSGHVTATMAFMTALFLQSKNKKYAWLGFILVILMGISRNYLMVHYPTDVIGGVLAGFIAGILAKKVMNKMYEKANTKTIKRKRYNE